MPAPAGKLTDLPELSAYVLAHAAGIAWGFLVNPMIIRGLIAEGHREQVMPIAIGLGISVSIIVLLIFLALRRAMAGSGATFCDFREIAAYVLAHAAGIAFNSLATPAIFRGLIAQGMRNLQPVAIALSITVAIVVLLIFLGLRRAMSGPAS
jgi:hypothetical protein